MTRIQRRLYMLSFVATFCLVAPVLVFLAKGYSFDRIGGVFVHNGAITIKSNPKKVDIYLDGKKVSNKMLNIINNYYVVNGVRFGKHTIECKKNGYTSWKKDVEVHSGVSTEFWNILLFPKKNTDLKTYSLNGIKRFYLSPRRDDELVLYREKTIQEKVLLGEDTSSKIKLANTDNANDIKLTPKTTTIDKIEKSISLLTTNDNQERKIYSTTADNLILIPEKNENVEWSSNHKKILVPITNKHPHASDNGANTLKSHESVITPSDNLPVKDYIIIDIKNKELPSVTLLDIMAKVDLLTLLKNNDIKKTVVNDDISLDKHSSGESLAREHIEKEQVVFLPKIHQARWMFDSAHKIIVLTENHELLLVDIVEPDQVKLLAKDVNGFDLAGDHVYYSNLKTNTLWDIKPNRPEYSKKIYTTNLKDAPESFLKIFAYDELRIALITSSKTLYILNKIKPEDTAMSQIVEHNILNIQFSDDGKKMLYWTDKSFWVYMLREWDKQPQRKKGEKILVASSLEKIKNIQWMETYENIFFTTNDSIKSAELDNRSKINISKVADINSIPERYNYLYDKETSIVYFLDHVNKNNTSTLEKINTFKLKSIKLLEHTGLFGFNN